MKVYIVRAFSTYEGGGPPLSIHATFEGAKDALLKYVEEENAWLADIREKDNLLALVPNRNKSLLLYSDGFENAAIVEYEVQP